MAGRLTDEQRALVETVRDLLAVHCTPEQLRAAEASGAGWMPALWRDLGRAGFLGLGVSTEAGGTLIDAALVAMECGRALAPVPIVEAGLVAAQLLQGVPETVPTPALLSGETVAVAVIGHGLTTSTSTLRRVPYATAADVLILADRDEGMLGVVRADTVDVRRVPAMGPAPFGCVELGGLGEMHRRPNEVAAAIDLDALGRAAVAAGGMTAALTYAAAYVSERKQFGRPVGSFQAVQHQLADAAIAAEQARLLVLRAASAGPHQRAAATAAAHTFCLPAYRRVAATACQVLGGYGFALEYDSQLHLRAATSLLIGGAGTYSAEALVRDALRCAEDVVS